MKKYLVLFAVLYCWIVVNADHITPPPPPEHGHLSCIDFGGTDYICQITCDKGYVPGKPIPHSYDYNNGRWDTFPAKDSDGNPFVFPWPNCVAASK